MVSARTGNVRPSAAAGASLEKPTWTMVAWQSPRPKARRQAEVQEFEPVVREGNALIDGPADILDSVANLPQHDPAEFARR
jgi:hypothetical protein